MIEGLLSNTDIYLLVFVRLAGMIGLNPLLNRKNLPATLRVGLIFFLAVIVTPTVDTSSLVVLNSIDLMGKIVLEVTLGFVCGFVFQVFYYFLFFVGDTLDVQFGMSMAKVFDPGTNVQMSITGNLISLIFILYIFATNTHLLLIQIFATSFQIVPLGGVIVTSELAGSMVTLFAEAFSLVFRLAAPFIAAELVLEVSMGILMKLIPQIHVFVINIQFKMLLALILLMAFADPIASFIDNYMWMMFRNMRDVLYTLT